MNPHTWVCRAGLALLAAAGIAGASRAAVSLTLSGTSPNEIWTFDNDYLTVTVKKADGKVTGIIKKTGPGATLGQSSTSYPSFLDRVNQASPTVAGITLTENPDGDDSEAKRSLQVSETIGTTSPKFAVTKVYRLRDASKYLEAELTFTNSASTDWTPLDVSNGVESIFYATPGGFAPGNDLITVKTTEGIDVPQVASWWGAAPLGTAVRPELAEGWMAFTDASNGVVNALTWDLAAHKSFSQGGVSCTKLYLGSDRFQLEPLFTNVPAGATLHYKQCYIVDDGVPVVSYAAPESVIAGISLSNYVVAPSAAATATFTINSTSSTDATYDLKNIRLENAFTGETVSTLPDITGIAVAPNAHVAAGTASVSSPSAGEFVVKADLMAAGTKITTLSSLVLNVSAGSTYTYKNGYVALDKANMGASVDDKYVGFTAGQERGIAVRPATASDPMIIYNARGGASTGDGRASGTTAGIAAIKVQPYNGSNYTDTGLIISADQTNAPLGFVQDLTYDPVTDKVWLFNGGSGAVLPGGVYTIDGGVVGGAPNGGDPSATNNAAVLRFAVPKDLYKEDGSTLMGGSNRGIAVRTEGTVTTVYLGAGNHLEVWKYESINGTAVREYATKMLPGADTVDARTLGGGRRDGVNINGLTVDSDGNCYVNQQYGSYGRIWRFPGSRPASVPAGTLLDVDDRAMGGNNGGSTTDANVGIPVVVRCPSGIVSPYGWQSNYASLQNVEWFTDGINKGLFISFNSNTNLYRSVTRAILNPLNAGGSDPLVGTANGGPYIDATIVDAFGNAAWRADTSMQDPILSTFNALSSSPQTQPNAGSNGLIYTQAMTDANGIFTGQLFANGAVQDLTKGQGRSTFGYMDIAVAPVKSDLPAISISDPEYQFSTSAQSVWASWTTDVPATQRSQAGPFVPQGIGTSDFVNIPDAAGNVEMSTQHGGTVGSVSVLPGQPFCGSILAWAPGYKSSSKDATFTSDIKVRAAAASSSSPVVWNNVVYFGANDGKLYAMDNATGDAPAGFPYDAKANGSVAGVYSRPAIYFLNGETQPTIFFTTLDYGMHAVNLDGSRRWFCDLRAAGWTSGYGSYGYATSSTPALVHMDDGDYVFVGAIAKKASNNTECRIIKVNAVTGAIAGTSPVLGKSTSALVSISSPAVAAGTVSVGISNPATGNGPAIVLKATDLTPLVAAGPTSESANGAPYINQPTPSAAPVMYISSSAGKVYAVDLTTALPVSTFGSAGVVQLPSFASAHSNLYGVGNRIYTSNSGNAIFALDAITGAGAGPDGSALLFQAPTVGSILGVTVDPQANGGRGAVYAGSSDGYLYEVPVNDPFAFRAYTMLDGTQASPAIDPVTRRVFITGVDGNIYRFPGFPSQSPK